MIVRDACSWVDIRTPLKEEKVKAISIIVRESLQQLRDTVMKGRITIAGYVS